jgi:hypothetical protein
MNGNIKREKRRSIYILEDKECPEFECQRPLWTSTKTKEAIKMCAFNRLESLTTHLQVDFSAINAPHMGPTTGPNSGAKEYMASA